MTDLSQTIAPRSDQMNADDLIGGPRTITVTKVSQTSNPEQPIAVSYEGDNGKPYKPGLSMRRVLVRVWGNDGNAYAGRRMTLYRDDKVRFGGVDVGGIRISHMSDIDSTVTMALTDKKGSRKPHRVEPLQNQTSAPKRTKADLFVEARAVAVEGSFALDQWRAELPERARAAVGEIAEELDAAAVEADERASVSEDSEAA